MSFLSKQLRKCLFFEETILIMHNFDNCLRDKFWKYILYEEQF